jgi:hypothetical protein
VAISFLLQGPLGIKNQNFKPVILVAIHLRFALGQRKSGNWRLEVIDSIGVGKSEAGGRVKGECLAGQMHTF